MVRSSVALGPMRRTITPVSSRGEALARSFWCAVGAVQQSATSRRVRGPAAPAARSAVARADAAVPAAVAAAAAAPCQRRTYREPRRRRSTATIPADARVVGFGELHSRDRPRAGDDRRSPRFTTRPCPRSATRSATSSSRPGSSIRSAARPRSEATAKVETDGAAPRGDQVRDRAARRRREGRRRSSRTR